MSTPTKKRRLPDWASSGISPAPREKEAKVPTTSTVSEQRASRRIGSFEDKEVYTITDGGPHEEDAEIPPCGGPQRKLQNGEERDDTGTKLEVNSVATKIADKTKGNLSDEAMSYKGDLKALSTGSTQGDTGSTHAKQIRGDTDESRHIYSSHTHDMNSLSVRSQNLQSVKAEPKSDDEFPAHGTTNGGEKNSGPSAFTQNAENKTPKPRVRKFSELLEGVIFTISGLVNPERAELRKMALDMGAQYSPSWSADSTLLVAAFANTPSFNQVKAVGGTIVHKDWVVECYKSKELVAIEKYMLHVGNPWRAGYDIDRLGETGVEEEYPSNSIRMEAPDVDSAGDKRRGMTSTSPGEDNINTIQNQVSGTPKKAASTADIQLWVLEDLAATCTWLEEQSDKPEQDQLEATAAHGLVACLDDAVKSLQGSLGLSMVMDNWAFIPRAVKELAVFEKENRHAKDRLVGEGERFQLIYSTELQKMGFGVNSDHKDKTTDAEEFGKAVPGRTADSEPDDDATDIISDADSRDPADFDSDGTEDLDEEEITQCQIRILRGFSLA